MMRDFFSKDYQLFFAYGSNMNEGQIRSRCQKPEVFAMAWLPDHEVSFFGYSARWDGGEATVMSRPGQDVWGVVYKLSFADAERLDSWQGVRLDGGGPYFHFPTEVTDARGVTYPVLLYKKDILNAGQRPSAEYLGHIVQGALARGLPPSYVEHLRKTQTITAGYPVPKEPNFDPSRLAQDCECGKL
jgi:hypothetical protein